MANKPEYLVVDTTAFIRNAPLQEMGQNIVTIQEVVNEITSKRQLRRLVVIPYDLKIMNVFPESVSFITEFSKKTGDYMSLSATDIKLMALAYQLEKEHVGVDHLKTAPVTNRIVTFDRPKLSAPDPAGFYKGTVKESSADNEVNEDDSSTLIKEGDERTEIEIVDFEKPENQVENVDSGSTEESSNLQESNDAICEEIDSDGSEDDEKSLVEDLSKLNVTDVLSPVSDEEYEDKEESEDEDDDESDWITPENLHQAKMQMDFGLTEDKAVTVACITTDFAMQNVLKQIGLNVVGLDGRVIKHLRTFIFRCYACFKTTSNMTKVFCPKCGNKTLKKVSVSVDENGQQVIHINPRKRLTARGKKFSLPRPQGGKHSNNPILCEDQPMPDQRPSRLARTKTNPLDDDYIAGFSPFVMRDVNSRSAMLGIQGKHTQVKYWMRKNPNEVVKHGRRKKK
ncbi:RNA-binding protein NOB1-like [Macrosteles quadrilineatus]|uniref:RNA-binding protein NOB1-like n=1 Tax=Macrosteles quadrilineatus TaxID=74068 RepID=UPI0023E138AC|nr:RNA-binding protein NOB1-like [Macrosteles quadrilineatus]